MNTFGHCLLSQQKFGGQPQDYQYIHYFIDSSKFFLYHAKHRVCLHNLYGVELAVQLLGEFITNSDGNKISVELVAKEHCKEDLNGYIPSLYDFFKDNKNLEELLPIKLPSLNNEIWDKFLLRPYEMSGLRATLLITYSDLGVKLLDYFYGEEAAQALDNALQPMLLMKDFLHQFKFTEQWQNTLNQVDLDWLNEYYKKNPETEQNGKWLVLNLKNFKNQ
jgi:hypothetical protein